jgi:hypothetical protein
MKRTVTALYETRAQAERVRDALVSANLGDQVDIRDESGEPDGGGSQHRDFKTWLGDLMGGHADRHVYIEGVRRGHYMLSAKVDELSETRAAEILNAAAPLDLETAQTSWRAEGWAPPEEGAGGPVSTASGHKDLNAKAPTRPAEGEPARSAGAEPTGPAEKEWAGVRLYSFTDESW